jgi:hypothetical protein
MTEKVKICRKCGEAKPLSEYYKDTRKRDGCYYICIDCAKQWRANNAEAERLRKQKYYQAHLDKCRADMRANYVKNRERRKAQSQEYREINRDKYREYFKELNKSPERREYNNSWRRNRYKTDPLFKLNDKMAGYLNRMLKGGKGRRTWEDLVGYTCEDLKRHIESLFTEGMTWEKYLNGEIHIDHIIPKSLFNITDTKSKGFKKCWALENLRPLWARENLQKSNKLFAA